MLNHKDKLDGIDAIEGTRLVYNGKHKRLERREGIDRENVSISRDKNKVFTLNEPSFNRRLNIKRFENMHFVFWVTDVCDPRDQTVYL